jgi:hypothetical protein
MEAREVAYGHAGRGDDSITARLGAVVLPLGVVLIAAERDRPLGPFGGTERGSPGLIPRRRWHATCAKTPGL